MSPYIWLGLVIFFLVIEIATLGLTTIWFAGGSLAAFFLNLADVPVLWQVITAILVSFLLMLTIRPFANRRMNGKRTKTNADRLEGMEAFVKETIDNVNGTGCISVEGLEWMARTDQNDKRIIPEGTLIRILRVEGAKVIVEPVSGESK